MASRNMYTFKKKYYKAFMITICRKDLEAKKKKKTKHLKQSDLSLVISENCSH